MYAYNELTVKRGELFIYSNSKEANELIGELQYQGVTYSYDQHPYSGEVFITILGGNA